MKPPPVKLIVKEQEEEEAQMYLTRAENMATALGPTLWERQIGVRVGQPEGPVSYRRTWKVSVARVAAHGAL